MFVEPPLATIYANFGERRWECIVVKCLGKGGACGRGENGAGMETDFHVTVRSVAALFVIDPTTSMLQFTFKRFRPHAFSDIYIDIL